VIVWVSICHLLDAGWLGLRRIAAARYFGRYP